METRNGDQTSGAAGFAAARAGASTTGSATTGITITNVNAGSGSAMALLPPTMILTKIVRIQ